MEKFVITELADEELDQVAGGDGLVAAGVSVAIPAVAKALISGAK